MKLSLIIILISLSTQLFATSVVKSAREDELKLDLTERGYNTLKAALINSPGIENSTRVDVYFEVYQRPHYALKALRERIKLRVMTSQKEAKWQIKKTVASNLFAPFTHNTTLTDEVVVSAGYAEDLIENYFSKLEHTDKDAIKAAGLLQEKLISDQLLKNALNLCILCTNDQNYFPTHQNRKERLKLKVTIDGEVFKVLLGKTLFKEKIFYELEAELKNAADITQSAARLNNWLQKKGMQQADVINDNFDQTRAGLDKLNQIQSL